MSKTANRHFTCSGRVCQVRSFVGNILTESGVVFIQYINYSEGGTLDTFPKRHPCCVRFHDIKHIHAPLLLKAAIHHKIVSERLGHADYNSTLDTYSHVLPGLQERASECLDEILGPRVTQ